MSEIERHVGRIKKVDLKGLSVDDFFKNKCEESGIEKNQWHDSYKEAFCEQSDENPYIVNGEDIWEIIEDEEEDDYEELMILTPNNDGTLSFVAQYYNGGTYLEEMIENGLKKLKDKTE